MAFALEPATAAQIIAAGHSASESLEALGKTVQQTEWGYQDALRSQAGHNMQHNVDQWQTYQTALLNAANDLVNSASNATRTGGIVNDNAAGSSNPH